MQCRVYLSNNRLTSLPMNMVTLSNVTELYLYNNKLSEWPPALFAMTQLSGLYLYDNQLRCMPSDGAVLKLLKILNLGGNDMTHIDPALGQLANLEVLYLHNNLRLCFLSSTLCGLTRLDTLYSSGTSLPKEARADVWRNRDRAQELLQIATVPAR